MFALAFDLVAAWERQVSFGLCCSFADDFRQQAVGSKPIHSVFGWPVRRSA